MTSAIFLTLISLLSHLLVLTAQPDFFFHKCFNESGNYIKPSAYHTNLNALLSNFTSDTKIDYGFYNYSHGETPNTINALGMCRGDVKPYSCRTCLNNATILLPQLCPNQKEAVGFYDLCMFRYSNRSIFGKYDASGDTWFLQNKDNTKTVIYELLWKSLDRVMNKSATGDSRLKFAAGNVSGYVPAPLSRDGTVYSVSQCTPDLSVNDCKSCLQKAHDAIYPCCLYTLGSWAFNPSCNIRFENYLFFDPAALSTPASPPPSTGGIPPWASPPPSVGGKQRRTGSTKIVLIVAPIIISATLLCLSFYLLRRKQRKREQAILTKNFGEESSKLQSLRFSLTTIEAATNKFSPNNRIGKGGFGDVYRGILDDGQEIAVKRLSKNSVQGAVEFKNEVLLIAKL